MTQWILRWKTWIAPTKLKGVWRRKEGGHLIRVRVTAPRTGQLREIFRVVEGDAAAAYSLLQQEAQRIRDGVVAAAPRQIRFHEYAAQLLERKVAAGEIRSVSGREKWACIVTRHLLPAFGEFYIDRLRWADVEAWRAGVAKRIQAGEYSPNTGNDWMAILRVIMGTATAELEMERNPTAGVRDFDTTMHRTYTYEEPNCLRAEEAQEFLACMRERFPQHFAMTALGFATGLRPSSLRPLRRREPCADVLWKEGVVLIRQSHTRRQEVMQATKTGLDQHLKLPEDMFHILRWHVDMLPDGPMRDSDLLFPSETGGYRSTSCLDKPFKEVTKLIGIKKHITPRAMRRTFQDLARAAELKDVVTRAVCGHVTESMTRRYSTVAADEMQQGLVKVLALAGVPQAHARGALADQVVGKVVGSSENEKGQKEEEPPIRPDFKDLRRAGDGT